MKIPAKGGSGIAAALLFGVGGLLIAEDLRLAVKGRLAARLIDSAFRAHLEDGAPHRPWPWADFHPVAHLAVPRLGVDRIVLSGASGTSMAFGPGHLDGTAVPGTTGNSVVAGHRDSSFGFVGALARGDEIVLETKQGKTVYIVETKRVVDRTDVWITERDAWDGLVLVTCHPVDGLLPTDARLAVFCRFGR